MKFTRLLTYSNELSARKRILGEKMLRMAFVPNLLNVGFAFSECLFFPVSVGSGLPGRRMLLSLQVFLFIRMSSPFAKRNLSNKNVATGFWPGPPGQSNALVSSDSSSISGGYSGSSCGCGVESGAESGGLGGIEAAMEVKWSQWCCSGCWRLQ